MSEFTKIAEIPGFPAGEAQCVEVAGRKIAVFNVDGVYYAIDDACTHREGPLSEGTMHGTVITCPWHGASFDLTSGEALSTPAPRGVRDYKVQVEGKAVKIAIPS